MMLHLLHLQLRRAELTGGAMVAMRPPKSIVHPLTFRRDFLLQLLLSQMCSKKKTLRQTMISEKVILYRCLLLRLRMQLLLLLPLLLRRLTLQWQPLVPQVLQRQELQQERRRMLWRH